MATKKTLPKHPKRRQKAATRTYGKRRLSKAEAETELDRAMRLAEELTGSASDAPEVLVPRGAKIVHPDPEPAEVREPTTFPLTGSNVWRMGEIADNAAIGDVVLLLFRDVYSEDDKTFTEAVTRCMKDELFFLEQALLSDLDMRQELRPMLDRMRNRLIVARWLDDHANRQPAADEVTK